jgi:hypothetical protein
MPKVKVVNSSKEVDLDRVVELSQGDLVVATLDGK